MTNDSAKRDSDLGSIRYFWEEKGDVTRYCDWERCKADFPEIEKAWNDFKLAERVLDAVINGVKQYAEAHKYV